MTDLPMNEQQLISRLRSIDTPIEPSPRFSDELFETLARERRGNAGRRFSIERPQLLQMAAAGLGILLVVGISWSFLTNQNTPAVTPRVVSSPSPSPVGSDPGPAPNFVPWSEPWGGQIASVVEWGGELIAVGNLRGTEGYGFARPGSGAIWTSPDGRAWDRITLPQDVDASDLVEAYVAGSGELVVFSAPEDRFQRPSWRTSDLETWEPIQLPGLDSPLVVGEPGAYLMINKDSSTELWESTDGLSWQSIDLGNLDADAGVIDIAVGDQGRVLSTCDRLAEDFPPGMDEGCRLWVSTDGETWQPSDGVPTPMRVAWFAGEWVGATAPDEPAGAEHIQLWRSTDGFQWTPTSQITEGFVNREPERFFRAADHLLLKAGPAYTRSFVCNDSVVCQPTGIEEIIANDAAALGDLVVLVGSSFGATGSIWSWDTASQ